MEERARVRAEAAAKKKPRIISKKEQDKKDKAKAEKKAKEGELKASMDQLAKEKVRPFQSWFPPTHPCATMPF